MMIEKRSPGVLVSQALKTVPKSTKALEFPILCITRLKLRYRAPRILEDGGNLVLCVLLRCDQRRVAKEVLKEAAIRQIPSTLKPET